MIVLSLAVSLTLNQQLLIGENGDIQKLSYSFSFSPMRFTISLQTQIKHNFKILWNYESTPCIIEAQNDLEIYYKV